jgi:hypothetical protein
MSTHRARRLDRRAAEQLLAGARSGPLAGVLRAAAAPAHPEELAGEAAAMAAFLADAQPVPAPRRSSALRSLLAKVLTVKALLVVAAAGTTGVVLAASGSVVPLPRSGPSPEPPAITTTTQTPPPPSTASSPVETGSADRTRERPGAPATARTGPEPSMTGLCRAYAAQARHDRGKALDNPAFSALVTAAGGEGHVDAYCAAVTATTPRRKPDHRPKSTGHGRPDPGPPPQASVPAKPPGQAQTPVIPTPGAAQAVPPSGAEPPSRGG